MSGAVHVWRCARGHELSISDDGPKEAVAACVAQTSAEVKRGCNHGRKVGRHGVENVGCGARVTYRKEPR